MRAAFIVAIALAVAACSSSSTLPVPLSGSADASAPIIVATLSTNPCEARTAPVYTAGVVATERATAYVKSGRLGESEARQVLSLGRKARSDLDAACVNKAIDASRLAAAEAAVVEMQTILGGVR